MTPEEAKAKELFDTYYDICSDIGSFRSDHINKEAAKQSALICVEEILKDASDVMVHVGRGGITDYAFWQKVKTHLINS